VSTFGEELFQFNTFFGFGPKIKPWRPWTYRIQRKVSTPGSTRKATFSTCPAPDSLNRLAFNEGLEKVLALVNQANKFAEDRAPWKLVKEDREKAKSVLVEMARALKLAALALHPVMPSMTQEMWQQLGETVLLAQAAPALLSSGTISFAPGQKIHKGAPLFPRKETK
jgi:methionyl-tRNA synthetase